MPRSRLRRSSSLTEWEAPRGSKSGMRFNSPRVRGFERPEDCIDVPVMGSRSASRTSRLATASSIRARCHQRAGAWPLTSVDAGPIREGTPPGVPGDPLPTEARGFAASTIGPSEEWPQRDKKDPLPQILRDSSDSRRRSEYGRLRIARRVRAGRVDWRGTPGHQRYTSDLLWAD